MPTRSLFQDTRILSGWILTVNGQALEPLVAKNKQPYRAKSACRVPRSYGYADSPLIVERLREVGAGILEEITVQNYSPHAAECIVALVVESDFADLFEVKEACVPRHWEESRRPDGDSLAIWAVWRDVRKGVVVKASGADVAPEGITFRITVPPHGHWTTLLRVVPSLDGTGPVSPIIRPAEGEISPGDRRHQEWVAKIPVLHVGNPSIDHTLRRSYEDLRALRIEGPQHPDRVVVAAGAPWFMALFGPDSIWASIMSLVVDPSLALRTLQTLADRQGKVVDNMSEEEPGKILNEVRLDASSGLALGGKSAYYGSVDATPLFVPVLGEVSRWGFAKDTIAALLPNADRAGLDPELRGPRRRRLH